MAGSGRSYSVADWLEPTHLRLSGTSAFPLSVRARDGSPMDQRSFGSPARPVQAPTVKTAPATIRPIPMPRRSEMGSPRVSHASATVIGRLSLSMGATLDAGASCSALKYASQDRPGATPDSKRNARARPFKSRSRTASPCAKTIPQANTRTTSVRTAVARFDGTP